MPQRMYLETIYKKRGNMFNAFKELLKSRKFFMTMAGTIAVVIMNQLGVDHAIIATIAGLFGVNIAGIAFEGPKK